MSGIRTEEGTGSATLRIEGALAGSMVAELERRWRCLEHARRCCVRLDLCRVGEIDQAGKDLLRTMFSQGVQLVVAAHAISPYVKG